MNTNFFINSQTQMERISISEPDIKPDKQQLSNSKPVFFAIAVLIIIGIVIYAISKDRETKRDNEIERISDKKFDCEKCCEQYVLVAQEDGWYPCYQPQCEKATIWLNAGEVWKYGKTCLGEKKRYSSGLPTNNLIYAKQFEGTEQECLIEEKRKIYNYPLLPEAMARNIKLVRPPGNKIDN